MLCDFLFLELFGAKVIFSELTVNEATGKGCVSEVPHYVCNDINITSTRGSLIKALPLVTNKTRQTPGGVVPSYANYSFVSSFDSFCLLVSIRVISN